MEGNTLVNADRGRGATGTLDDATAAFPDLSGADLEEARLFASVRARLFGGQGTLKVGRYEISKRIGAGGMGEVFLARDEALDRDVALKLVRPHLVDARWAARLRREARALARLAHPNVVRVYEVGEHEGRVYLAMEYVRGQSLRAWLGREDPPPRVVLAAYLEAGRGLAAAHGAGLTHRDFKPDNVLRGDDGRILVADFGLASLGLGLGPSEVDSSEELEVTSVLEPPRRSGESGVAMSPGAMTPGAMSSRTESWMTGVTVSHTGERAGTPAYMPPEQFLADSVDARADQFAFCVALYEGLWGRRPFPDGDLSERLDSISAGLSPTPPAESRPGLPRGLWSVLRRGLSADPDARWESMEALLGALEGAAQARARRGRWLAVGALALTMGGVGLGAGIQAGGTEERAPASCRALARGLDETWDEDRREALRTVFLTTELSWAEAATPEFLATLGIWAGRWREAEIEVCEAERAGGDALLRSRHSACLLRARQQFSALLEVLEQTDAAGLPGVRAAIGEFGESGVAGGPGQSGALGDPRTCVDDQGSFASTPGPSPEQRAAVTRVTQVLDRAQVQIWSGRYSRARAGLRGVEPELLEIGYVPVQARLLELRGRAQLVEGELEAGFTSLLEAADLAEGSGDDRVLASAWRFLALHALLDARDSDRGERWLRRAEASARRVGRAPAEDGELATIRGHRALLANDPEQAEIEFRTAVGDLQARSRTMRLVDARSGLGQALVRRGALEEGLAEYERARGEAGRSFGLHHPTYGSRAYDVGATLLALGREAEAELALREAVAVWTEAYAEPHPNLGNTHILLAAFDLGAGRLAAGEAQVDAAERVYRDTRPAEHPDFGDVASARGAIAFARGDFELASDALSLAIERYAVFGPEDPYLAKVRADRGWARLAGGELELARADFLAADAPLSAAADLAGMRESGLFGLCVLALSEGRARMALAHLDAMLELGRNPDDSAQAELWRGVARWRLGERGSAREHLRAGAAAVPEARHNRALAVAGVSPADLEAMLESPD